MTILINIETINVTGLELQQLSLRGMIKSNDEVADIHPVGAAIRCMEWLHSA